VDGSKRNVSKDYRSTDWTEIMLQNNFEAWFDWKYSFKIFLKDGLIGNIASKFF